MMSLTAWAQSGVDYDPENPADPAVFYTLTMEVTPRSGGRVGTSRMSVEAGQTVYCYAYAKAGYVFKQWMMGDSLVSTQSSFRYTMPAQNVALVAFFEYEGYNPENPGDPFADGYKHNVRVYATPSVGGYFNSSSFTLTEGEVTTIYAYPRNGYRFVSWKKDGKIISTENPLNIKMDTEDLEYTATFVYDPASPEEPGVNNFNVATGELIIDKFSAGNLNSAISSTVGGWENYSLVQSIVVVGQMTSSDFGFSNNLNNCSFIDLSRTTGYTDIPAWSFEGMNALTKIILPSTVKQINNKAFSGCNNLSEFVCYATVPPLLSASAFDSTAGLVVRVPFVSLDLYREADVWKNMTILPLDEDTYSLNVSLPADAGDGRYKNMTLELNNISSGQVLKYVITDRTVYSFANLIKDTKYNVLVKNSLGVVLGTIFDINIIDNDVNIAFDSLLQPRNVSVKIVTPENVDVTSQTTITWFNENGKYLGVGSELKGIVETSKISCSMSLEKELSTQYMTPLDFIHTVSSENNNISLELQPFEKIVISGIVKDLDTGLPLYNANVTISQVFNGKYSKSVVARTDNSGVFSSTINYTSCEIVVAANEYISQEFKIADLKNIDVLNDIQLKKVTGIRVKTDFTYTSSVFEGEVAETIDGYDDYSNISYSIYNKTTQKDITGFKVQSPYILLLEDIAEGDLLSITAISRNGAFKDVTADVIVDVINSINVTFPIVEWGKLQVAYNNSTSSKVVGILYDNKGELLRKITYNEASLTLGNLKDASYTLVTMESSDFFNSILNIDELEKSGLVEDVHFVKNNVTIQSGKITFLVIDNVPDFDDSKFYYTGSNTSFTVNKSSVTVGNYVTLRAKVDFKSKYADKVSDVKLVFDLPESCEFVENSVLTGSGTGGYSVEKNRIVVDVVDMDDVVRFCIIPTSGGECKPSAFVQFMFDGQEIQQPIGTALFEAELMGISVPQITSSTSVVVNGVATSDSEVRIYDNGVLVGTTRSIANGQWSSKVELYKPYSRSYHSICAEIISLNGKTFKTINKLLEFDKNYVSLSKVTMIYGGTTVVFDPIERKNSTNTYSYVPGNDEFTFTAEFVNTDTSVVKNVKFEVLASDGTIRSLDAQYNGVKQLWVAKSKYSSSDKLPINVMVDYLNTKQTLIYDDDMDADFTKVFDEMLDEIDSAYKNCKVDLINEYEKELYFSITPNNYEHKEYFKFIIEDYADVVQNTSSNVVYHIIDNELDYCFYVETTRTMSKLTIWDNNKKEAYSIIDNGSSVFHHNNGQQRILPLILSATYGIGTAVLEYYLNQPEIQFWYKTLTLDREKWNKDYQKLFEYLNALCDDGTFTIKDRDIYNSHLNAINAWWISTNNYFVKLKNLVDYEQEQLRLRCSLKGIANVVISAAGAIVSGLSSFLGIFFKHSASICERISSEVVNTAIIEAYGQVFSEAVGDYIDSKPPKEIISDWYCDASKKICKGYIDIVTDIKKSYSSCEKEDEEDDKKENDEKDDFSNPPLTPVIDPSGYVYEGVSSNRIEGVMASCYYKEIVEDMYGDLHENVVLWDAEEYAQENPLFTDKNGMYRWDVPQGLWQVKFEKEGYETAYSEWLPVPPPQLEVNIAMVQNKQPEVKNVHAYEEGVVIEFDKYMQPASLNEDNIYVVREGNRLSGVVTMLNEEIAYKGKEDTYASKARFVFDKPVSGGEITLLVSNKVKSYADVNMNDYFQQTFKVEKEIKEIAVSDTIDVPYGGAAMVTVTVLPADASKGKVLYAATASAAIVSLEESDAVIGEDGTAQFALVGELMGASAITFSVEGSDIKATAYVKVVEPVDEMIEMPTASLPTGTSVYRGTEVTLSAASDEYSIWYTTDDSCPCDENGTRILYSDPIVIAADVNIKAVAENSYGEASEVATFVYRIMQSTAGVVLDKGWNWVAFNMKDSVLNNVNSALQSGAWAVGDEIKNNLYTDSYSNRQGRWVGTLSSNGRIENTGMYMIHSSVEQTLNLVGEAVNPMETDMPVGPGWNYIAYLPMGSLSVAEALADYSAQDDDVIKSQDAFAIYSSGNGWEGSLEKLYPGKGYMLKRADNAAVQTFKYPATVVKDAANARTAHHPYANNMNIVARATGVELHEGDSVIAYAGNGVRGCAIVGSTDNIFLTVSGDERSDISFSVLRNGEVIATSETPVSYEPNRVLGNTGKPKEIRFVQDGLTSRFHVPQSIVTDELTIYVNERDVRDFSVAIYNTAGLVIKEYSEHGMEGGCERTYRMAGLSSGVYLVKVTINGGANIIKIVKK